MDQPRNVAFKSDAVGEFTCKGESGDKLENF
jgi:hypothetical protein